jgi:hypothetical protein
VPVTPVKPEGKRGRPFLPLVQPFLDLLKAKAGGDRCTLQPKTGETELLVLVKEE